MFLDEQTFDKATPGYTAVLLNLGVKCVSGRLAAAGKGEHHTRSHHAVVRCVKTQSDTPPIWHWSGLSRNESFGMLQFEEALTSGLEGSSKSN